MGMAGCRTRGVVGEGCRKERLLGDRAFAIEYREVRLKLKLKIGGPRNSNDRKGKKQEVVNPNRKPATQAQRQGQVQRVQRGRINIHERPGAGSPEGYNSRCGSQQSHYSSQAVEEQGIDSPSASGSATPPSLYYTPATTPTDPASPISFHNNIPPHPAASLPHPPTKPEARGHKPHSPRPHLPMAPSYVPALTSRKLRKESQCGSGYPVPRRVRAHWQYYSAKVLPSGTPSFTYGGCVLYGLGICNDILLPPLLPRPALLPRPPLLPRHFLQQCRRPRLEATMQRPSPTLPPRPPPTGLPRKYSTMRRKFLHTSYDYDNPEHKNLYVTPTSASSLSCTLCAAVKRQGNYSIGYTDEGEDHTFTNTESGDDYYEYELELGDEVYVQEIDAVW